MRKVQARIFKEIGMSWQLGDKPNRPGIPVDVEEEMFEKWKNILKAYKKMQFEMDLLAEDNKEEIEKQFYWGKVKKYYNRKEQIISQAGLIYMDLFGIWREEKTPKGSIYEIIHLPTKKALPVRKSDSVAIHTYDKDIASFDVAKRFIIYIEGLSLNWHKTDPDYFLRRRDLYEDAIKKFWKEEKKDNFRREL